LIFLFAVGSTMQKWWNAAKNRSFRSWSHAVNKISGAIPFRGLQIASKQHLFSNITFSRISPWRDTTTLCKRFFIIFYFLFSSNLCNTR
jgi:hypothetical protein